jgi:hypothetical protein
MDPGPPSLLSTKEIRSNFPHIAYLVQLYYLQALGDYQILNTEFKFIGIDFGKEFTGSMKPQPEWPKYCKKEALLLQGWGHWKQYGHYERVHTTILEGDRKEKYERVLKLGGNVGISSLSISGDKGYCEAAA